VQAAIIGIYVDFLAEVIFKSTPFFNSRRQEIKERNEYSSYFRMKNHAMFMGRAVVFQTFSMYIGCLAFPSRLQSAFGYFNADPSHLIETAGGPSRAYVKVAVLIQLALLASDFGYFAWHIVQHKSKRLYYYSYHAFHHQFRYPLGEAGKWLGFWDSIISGFFFAVVPNMLVSFLASKAGLGLFSPFDPQTLFVLESLITCYIHLMNDHDHSGKQMPLWSGFPLCPPMGFVLGLDQSIPNHESHHNKHNCGYGLLSVADRLFGTQGWPDSHKPKES
jgi:sterol desaturase/sphingolipid hydroxylase (fatty acid hydroxylase superfamily)